MKNVKWYGTGFGKPFPIKHKFLDTFFDDTFGVLVIMNKHYGTNVEIHSIHHGNLKSIMELVRTKYDENSNLSIIYTICEKDEIEEIFNVTSKNPNLKTLVKAPDFENGCD